MKVVLPALLIATVCSSSSHAATPDRITGALTASQMVTLKGNVHGLAKPEFDLGPADGSRMLHRVSLAFSPSAAQQIQLDQDLAQPQNETSPTGSFTLTPTATSYLVAQGSNLTVIINLTTTDGFDSPVTYTCSDPASESTCIGPSGYINSTTPAGFLITTTPATAQLHQPFDRGLRIFYATLLPGLLGIMFTMSSRQRSLRAMRLLGLIMLLGFSTLWLGSCAGSNSGIKNSGTPKQTYNNFTVSATTGGANPVTGSVTFSVTVQ